MPTKRANPVLKRVIKPERKQGSRPSKCLCVMSSVKRLRGPLGARSCWSHTGRSSFSLYRRSGEQWTGLSFVSTDQQHFLWDLCLLPITGSSTWSAFSMDGSTHSSRLGQCRGRSAQKQPSSSLSGLQVYFFQHGGAGAYGGMFTRIEVVCHWALHLQSQVSLRLQW